MAESTNMQTKVATSTAVKTAHEGVAHGEVKKLPLLPTLRKLEIGDTAVFPIEQYASVITTKSRLCLENSRIGWDARVNVNKDEFTVNITRIS